jgi:hypothetical protein
MSSLDSLDNVKYSINRFIAPIITIVIGIFLYSKTKIPVEVIQPNPNGEDFIHQVTQEPMFGYAGVFFIIVGIVWILFIFNLLKSFVGIGVSLAVTALGVYVLAEDYIIVETDVAQQNKKAHYFKEIKERLNDVKIAQIEYKNEKGEYTASFDSLIDFVKNGKTISYVRKGLTPGRPLTTGERAHIYGKKDNRALDNDMSDVEAKNLSLWVDAPDSVKTMLSNYKRDTVYVSVLSTVFEDNAYLEARAKLDLDFDFAPDSLRKMPFSGLEFTMVTDSISRGELSLSTLLIQAVHPDFSTDTLSIGDLKDNSLKDNWSLK